MIESLQQKPFNLNAVPDDYELQVDYLSDFFSLNAFESSLQPNSLHIDLTSSTRQEPNLNLYVQIPFCDQSEKWNVIKMSLLELSKNAVRFPYINDHDIRLAIAKYQPHHKLKAFDGLRKALNCLKRKGFNKSHFYRCVIPLIVNCALEASSLFDERGIPLLSKQSNLTITLSNWQCACLLSNMFLCTFSDNPVRYWTPPYGGQQTQRATQKFSLIDLLQNEERGNDLAMILPYFYHLQQSVRKISFHRQCVSPGQLKVALDTNICRLATVHDQSINNFRTCVMVESTGPMIGGNLIYNRSDFSNVVFLCRPETLIALLLVESLDSKRPPMRSS
ncbi:hypothetical protein ACOME3_000584 [Neoechinorhynchus agilis]